MSGFLMLLALAAATFIVVAHRTRHARSAQRPERDAQLTVAARAAQEDVTLFAEQLDEVEAQVETAPLDDPVRSAARRARRACSEARRALQAATDPDEIALVTRTLAEGRFALAFVLARVQGRPRPLRSTPCFFNPAHGPSACEVLWATAGEVPRPIPACAADAARVRAGAAPNIRTVPVGGDRVPYWQAGPAYEPYAKGYLSA